jgi:hypothetical protein
MTMSIGSPSNTANISAPVAAVDTWCPCLRKKAVNKERISSSSSTSRRCGIGNILRKTPSRFRSMSPHRHLFQVGHIAKAKPEQTFPRKRILTIILDKQYNILIYNNIINVYQSMPRRSSVLSSHPRPRWRQSPAAPHRCPRPPRRHHGVRVASLALFHGRHRRTKGMPYHCQEFSIIHGFLQKCLRSCRDRTRLIRSDITPGHDDDGNSRERWVGLQFVDHDVSVTPRQTEVEKYEIWMMSLGLT